MSQADAHTHTHVVECVGASNMPPSKWQKRRCVILGARGSKHFCELRLIWHAKQVPGLPLHITPRCHCPPPPLALLACPFYVASRKKKEFTAVLLPGDSNREQLTAQSRNDSPTTILHSTHTHTYTPSASTPPLSQGYT